MIKSINNMITNVTFAFSLVAVVATTDIEPKVTSSELIYPFEVHADGTGLLHEGYMSHSEIYGCVLSYCESIHRFEERYFCTDCQ